MSKILGNMMRAYVSDINKYINKSRDKVRRSLKPVIFQAIYTSPEMESVRGGVLKFDFGLPTDPTQEISNAVSESISIDFGLFKYLARKVVGNAAVKIQPTDYLNILSIPSAIVITEKGENLPWLEWLLRYGDSIIIIDFGVEYTEGGRSGGAIMTTRNRPFRVNSQFSGTEDDNFISRALSRNIKKIEETIWQTILN